MSCVLTSGFALDCKDTVGGVKKIWVIQSSKKGTFTKWLQGKNQVGGQHKVPRLSNERKIIEEILSVIN